VHGIESTIVAVRTGGMEILRPGPITVEQLAEFGEVRSALAGGRLEAPGQLPSHYAPRTPLALTSDLKSFVGPEGRIGALAFHDAGSDVFAEIRVLSASGDLHQAAANLFRYLRELDDAQLDLIIAECVPEIGIGSAIMDRLRRAAVR
jgi:L-threonylcarbamoyladenylate synthase